jgi:hypothetical protein
MDMYPNMRVDEGYRPFFSDPPSSFAHPVHVWLVHAFKCLGDRLNADTVIRGRGITVDTIYSKSGNKPPGNSELTSLAASDAVSI